MNNHVEFNKRLHG